MELRRILAGLEETSREQVDAMWRKIATALEGEVDRAGRGASERFNQLSRRLRMAESVSEWRAIVVETAGMFCGRAAVVDSTATAPAVATAVESRDTVVTQATASEVGPELASGEDGHCYLVPILQGERVAAVLYAERAVDRNALELVAVLAGMSIPKPPPSPDLVQLAAALQPEGMRQTSNHRS